MNFKQLEQYFIDHTYPLYGEDEAKEIYYMVIAHFTKWSRAQLLIHSKNDISDADSNRYLGIVEELKKGKPIQHIFNEAWFYGLRFKVSDAVLIPRPETEELVEWILQTIPKSIARDFSLLDIGTGSGCIAITLKKKYAALEVEALDISLEALAIAKENAESNEAAINFIHADILHYQSAHRYNLIVSNPPYIKEDEKDAMHQNVLLYEPHLALFVANDNPLIFYKSIADFARLNLVSGGKLFFEINEYLGEETIEMLKDKGFKDIVLKKDMQGKDRMIYCIYGAG